MTCLEVHGNTPLLKSWLPLQNPTKPWEIDSGISIRPSSPLFALRKKHSPLHIAKSKRNHWTCRSLQQGKLVKADTCYHTNTMCTSAEGGVSATSQGTVAEPRHPLRSVIPARGPGSSIWSWHIGRKEEPMAGTPLMRIWKVKPKSQVHRHFFWREGDTM